MLASMDLQGTVYIRNISTLEQAETVLYTITSVPKEVEDFAKVLFNSSIQNKKELLVIIND